MILHSIKIVLEQGWRNNAVEYLPFFHQFDSSIRKIVNMNQGKCKETQIERFV